MMAERTGVTLVKHGGGGKRSNDSLEPLRDDGPERPAVCSRGWCARYAGLGDFHSRRGANNFTLRQLLECPEHSLGAVQFSGVFHDHLCKHFCRIPILIVFEQVYELRRNAVLKFVECTQSWRVRYIIAAGFVSVARKYRHVGCQARQKRDLLQL